MNKKNLLIAIAVVAAVVALFWISAKLAAAVLLLSIIATFVAVALYMNYRCWKEIAEKDPKLANELWRKSMQQFDLSRAMF